MGRPTMAQRKQQDFDVDRLNPLRSACGADKEGLRFVGHAQKNALDFTSILRPPNFEKGFAAQFTKIQGIGATACNSHGKDPPLEFQNKRVGQDPADRAGLYVVTLRRAARAPQLVPVGIQ